MEPAGVAGVPGVRHAIDIYACFGSFLPARWTHVDRNALRLRRLPQGLTAADRMGTETLGLTQEFLAQMLGARRSTVTVAAGNLQRQGLIDYARGRVQILNRPGLEQVACECYRIVRPAYGRVLGEY